MDKKQVAKILEEIGILLELKGANPFRVRSYYSGARAIETLTDDIARLVDTDALQSIKGIGKGLAEAIKELVTTGAIQDHETLKASFPAGVLEMLKISGLGPKKVKIIYDKLEVTSIGELEYAARENRLRTMDGFGKKSEENILKGIELLKKNRGRFLTHMAREWAVYVIANIGGHPDVQRIEVAGSLRRHRETSKDIDIVASAQQSESLMDAFVHMDAVESVINHGGTKSSVRLQSGISVDLRVVEDQAFPFLLHHLTGSREHNTLMRGRAKKLGLKMNEYGIFKGDTALTCRDEAEIFKTLDLPFIPPEMREGLDEIDRAEHTGIPRLVEPSDMQGILHVHTTWSDGLGSVEEMVQAAQQCGAAYLGITDHSKAAFYANGLDEKRIREQHAEIDTVQKRNPTFRIFKGIEADILADGRMDYDEDTLASFDFVIASVHSRFSMSERDATDRLLTAINHPHVHILGHPTGRLLLGREGYPVHMETIIDAARNANVAIELNANPHRLDIDWRLLHYAMERGVYIAINPDAHRTSDYEFTDIGVHVARKGGVTPEMVINTWSAERLETFFRNGYDT